MGNGYARYLLPPRRKLPAGEPGELKIDVRSVGEALNLLDELDSSGAPVAG